MREKTRNIILGGENEGFWHPHHRFDFWSAAAADLVLFTKRREVAAAAATWHGKCAALEYYELSHDYTYYHINQKELRLRRLFLVLICCSGGCPLMRFRIKLDPQCPNATYETDNSIISHQGQNSFAANLEPTLGKTILIGNKLTAVHSSSSKFNRLVT